MRTGGLLALPSISYAVRRRAKCIAIMAGYWSDDSIERRFVNKRLARLLNDPCVFAAANHCRPATNSMLPFGLNPEKVFAWDFNKLPNPEQIPVKTRQSSDRIDIAFAGVLKFGKGIQDIVRAVQLLRARGVDVKLTVCGDGPVMPDVRQAAAGDPEGYQLLGFVDNHEVHRVFSQATLVCVASRKDHSEGLPLVISEALATRTPLIASDHPSMLDVLVESEGVRFFPSGDAEQLATVIQELGHDVDQYRHLSETAAAAIGRIDSDITIYDLLTRWRATW
jgi:glycosyltransferase involved in cell wall biosynthesis